MKSRFTAVFLGVITVFAAAVSATAPVSAATSDPSTIWSIQASPVKKQPRPNINVTVERGKTHKDSVIVSNFSTRDLTLKIYPQDAFQKSDGGFDLRTSAQPAEDLGAWIKVAATHVKVPARSTATVPFEITVPTNAPAGDHAAGIVTSLTSSTTDAGGAQVAVEHRVGTRVYLRVAGPVAPSVLLQDVSVSYQQPAALGLAGFGSARVAYTVVNTGNTRMSGEVLGQVTGPFGFNAVPIADTAIPELLPGAQYTGELVVEGVASTVRLNADLTLASRAVVQGSTVESLPTQMVQAGGWAVPWAWLVVIGSIVGAAIFFRRRRPQTPVDLRTATPIAPDETEIDLRTKVGATSRAQRPDSVQLETQADQPTGRLEP